jgi:hypothetical protein
LGSCLVSWWNWCTFISMNRKRIGEWNLSKSRIESNNNCLSSHCSAIEWIREQISSQSNYILHLTCWDFESFE